MCARASSLAWLRPHLRPALQRVWPRQAVDEPAQHLGGCAVRPAGQRADACMGARRPAGMSCARSGAASFNISTAQGLRSGQASGGQRGRVAGGGVLGAAAAPTGKLTPSPRLRFDRQSQSSHRRLPQATDNLVLGAPRPILPGSHLAAAMNWSMLRPALRSCRPAMCCSAGQSCAAARHCAVSSST